MGIKLASLYNYDPDIFENLNLPSDLSKDNFLSELLWRFGECDMLYSDPKFVKAGITSWSISSQYSWKHMVSTITAEYDPIENYNRYEETADDSSGTTTYQSHNSNDNTRNSTDKVYGYNDITSPADDSTTNETSTATGTDAGNGSSTSTSTRTGHVHGNIGVMTTQQMLKEEREAAMYNIYREIAEDFKRRFLIWVY